MAETELTQPKRSAFEPKDVNSHVPWLLRGSAADGGGTHKPRRFAADSGENGSERAPLTDVTKCAPELLAISSV
ncbi:MAG: hypothetical protein RL701_3686 [Pseudomonadota bacterium]